MTRVFLSVQQARDAVQAGAVPVDARGKSAWVSPRIPGSGALKWLTLRRGVARSGLLAEDLGRLGRAIRGAGVRRDRPVLVYGDADRGWGEEGRIFWMLEHLGHGQVHILDGGFQAWQAAGLKTGRLTSPAEPGDFEPQWGAGRLRVEEVIRAQQTSSHTLWDCRTQEEFEGATPFGEVRPGHIPGAKHLHWKDLLDPTGRVLQDTALRALLKDFRAPVVPLCTGGVRAAFCYAVLRHLGVETALFDGSMWEWAACSELPMTAD